MTRLASLFLVLWMAGLGQAAAADQLWQALREGRAVALIRHATAPGTGDPPGFRLDDCASQRNLSEAGRNEARRIGNAFRQNGIDGAHVITSAWCRARETAILLDLGRPEVAPSLASLHGRADARRSQVAELRAMIAHLPLGRPVVMVSHQATIAALLDVYPASGETVVVDRRSLQVLGRLPTP